MCTVSWLPTPGGYTLLCNRDELHTRRAALPPRVQQRGGVTTIAPTDAEAGGTWLGVNAYGLTLCLLNSYPPGAAGSAQRAEASTSRGMLVAALLDCATRAEVAARVAATALAQFQPWTLLVLEPDVPR